LSADITLNEFLKNVEGVYKSVDVRVASILGAENWQNALTVLRFSYLSIDDVTSKLKGLEDRWGKIDGRNFQIKLTSLDYDTFLKICETAQHVVYSAGSPASDSEKMYESLFDKVRDIPVNVFEALESILTKEWSPATIQYWTIARPFVRLLETSGAFRERAGLVREAQEWPCLEIHSGAHAQLLDDGKVQSHVRGETGFDLYDVIRELLEVDFQPNSAFNVLIYAPFYARRESVDFSAQTCEVQVKFHEKIPNLIANIVVRNWRQTHGPIVDKGTLAIEANQSQPLDERMMLWKGKAELPNAGARDHLYVDLAQKKTGLVIQQLGPLEIKQLLDNKSPMLNPLLAAFQQFCLKDDFEKYLSRPDYTDRLILANKWNKATTTHEQAVGWLLDLCGFQTIWLGATKHEHFKAPSGRTRGGVDILAYLAAKNLLFLIDCKAAKPKDDDFDTLRRIMRELGENVFKGTSVEIKSAVFVSETELGAAKQKGLDKGVKVLDADDIRQMFNLVYQGEVQKACNEYLVYRYR